MRRTRLITLLTLAVLVLLAFAPAAFAGMQNGGQGLYGESTDLAVTNVMFILIIFFPVCCLVLSLIQWRLEKRKYARLDAAKRRSANADWRGGW